MELQSLHLLVRNGYIFHSVDLVTVLEVMIKMTKGLLVSSSLQ